MNRALAEQVASPKGIDLSHLLKTTRDIAPKWVRAASSPEPNGGHGVISRSSSAALREVVPAWYSSPKESLHKCAKAVCDRYQNLCFFECLIVAKRLSDGDVSCSRLPDTLPYEVDEENRDSCAALVE